MVKIIENIEFDNDYPKLRGNKYALLVAVFNDIPGELLWTKFPDLVHYDTLRSDGRYYHLKRDENYMLLLFVGDAGMFTTFRKQTTENADKFNGSIGTIFNLKVTNKGGLWRK